jgi:hypothetical protein
MTGFFAEEVDSAALRMTEFSLSADSVSSRKTVHMTRRIQREVSFAPQGVLPPSDS